MALNPEGYLEPSRTSNKYFLRKKLIAFSH